MAEVTRAVGRYEIMQEIGRGGMAMVFLARQTDLDRLVALKELSAFHASDPQFAQRFLRESRLAGSLSHPNIVTVHEYFEHEGTPYIAMEYVPRGSLRPYVGRLSLAQVVGVIEGMLAGLTHAESKRIVHRDLKPENVMVTDEGRVKIADFGIAKAGEGMSTVAFMTATGTTVGTPAYMAPEQAMAKDIGPWTDLYSLGVMCYEMLVGRLPFSDTEAPMVLLMKHVNEPFPPPRSINPELDEELERWIMRLVEKDPQKRVRSAAEAWDELEESVIRIFGARWRREARLPPPAAAADLPRPLTPAPFDGASPGSDDDEFQSFAWISSSAVLPEPAAPPDAQEPAAPDAVDLPAPAAAAGEAVADSTTDGFETFGAPPAAPPEPPPASEPPVTSEPPADPQTQAPVADESATDGFQTFGAPPAPPAPPPAPEPEVSAPVPDTETAPEVPAPEPAATAEPAQPPVPDDEWGATIAPRRAPAPATEPSPAPAGAAAAVAAPTAPDVAEGTGPRRRTALIAGIAAAVVLAVIGFLVAPSSKHASRSSTLPNSASGGGVELGFPSGWRHVAAAPAVPGLKLTDMVALGGPAAGASIVAGTTDATGPTLLPAAFLARLQATPRGVPVKLGSVTAYRYTGLAPGSPAQRLTVYAVPTDRGVVTLACVGAAAVASPDCETIASSMRLQGLNAYPLGPSSAYAQALGGAIGRLNTAAAGARSRLAAAKTPAGQASAAAALATAYDTAAAAVRKITVSPADSAANAAIGKALTTTGAGYSALSAAARRRDRAAYQRAAAAVKTDEAAVTSALDALHDLGYAPPA